MMRVYLVCTYDHITSQTLTHPSLVRLTRHFTDVPPCTIALRRPSAPHQVIRYASTGGTMMTPVRGSSTMSLAGPLMVTGLTGGNRISFGTEDDRHGDMNDVRHRAMQRGNRARDLDKQLEGGGSDRTQVWIFTQHYRE